jgi:hypothetical protein
VPYAIVQRGAPGEICGRVCVCVLDALLFFRTSEDRKQKKLFLLHLQAYRAFHTHMIDKLRARLARDPKSRGALGHGLLRLYVNQPVTSLPKLTQLSFIHIVIIGL